MAAPSFIQEAEVAWNTDTTPKTTASFDVVTGDVLVAWAIIESYGSGAGTPTLGVSGGTLTWTSQQLIQATDYCSVQIWTAVVDTDKSMTVALSKSGGAAGLWFGGNVLTFRGSDGVGASNKANAATGDPAVTVTTTQDDSAVVMASGDWNATDGGTRAYNTSGGGTFSETSYFRDASHYAVYGGYYANVGALGGQAIGISDPNGQKWAIVGVEVKGTAGAPATAGKRTWRMGLMGVQ